MFTELPPNDSARLRPKPLGLALWGAACGPTGWALLTLTVALASCGDEALDRNPSSGLQASPERAQSESTALELAHDGLAHSGVVPVAEGDSQARKAATTPTESAGGPEVPADGLRVHVRASNGVSSDAEVLVFVLDRRHYDIKSYRLAQSRAPRNAWGIVERFGRREAEGKRLEGGEFKISIPLPARRSYVYARAGELFGRARVQKSNDEPLVISLDQRAIDAEPVRVFRSTGQPAQGISVRGAVLSELGAQRVPDFDSASVTGADGTAWAYRVQNEDAFAAEVHGIAPVASTKDGRGSRIDLPPMGRLKFHLPKGSNRATVQVLDGAGWRPLLETRGDGSSGESYEFAHVAAGLTGDGALQYVVRQWDSKAEGPVPPIIEDGQLVEIWPDLVPRRRVKMQLVRDGIPLAEGTGVLINVLEPSGSPSDSARGAMPRVAADLDSEGRSVWTFDRDDVSLVPGSRLRVLTTQARRGVATKSMAMRTIGILDADRQVIDLGSLEMQPFPLVAAGTVRDEVGRPVEGAIISIHQEYAHPEDGEGTAGRMGGGYQLMSGAYAERSSVQSGPQGEFELRGLGDPTMDGKYQLSLSISATGFADHRSAPFLVGSEDLMVQLPPGGSMAIESGKMPTGFTGRLTGTVTHFETGTAHPFELTRRTIVPSLLEGKYTLTLSLRSQEILRIDDLYVPRGGDCRDARLLLDLKDLVRPCELKVVGPDRKPIWVATLFRQHESDDHWSKERIKSPEGWAKFTTAAQIPVRRYISARGYVAQEVTDVPSGSTVVLEALHGVTLTLEGSGRPKEGSSVSITPPPLLAGTPGLRDQMTGIVSAEGTVHLLVPGLGSYEVIARTSWEAPSRPLGVVAVTGSAAVLQTSR